MLRFYVAISLAFVSLLAISCQEKTPKEKLEAAIEKDPDFLRKLEKSIDTQIKANILVELDTVDIPNRIKTIVGGRMASYFSMDLDKDSRREIIALADSVDRVKLYIIKMDLNGQIHPYSSQWIMNADTVRHSFDSKFGALEWTRISRKEKETLSQKILIRYESLKNDFCLAQLDEERRIEVKKEEFIIQQKKSNYITKESVLNCKSKSYGLLENSHVTKMELDLQLPRLSDLNDGLLDGQKSHCLNPVDGE